VIKRVYSSMAESKQGSFPKVSTTLQNRVRARSHAVRSSEAPDVGGSPSIPFFAGSGGGHQCRWLTGEPRKGVRIVPRSWPRCTWDGCGYGVVEVEISVWNPVTYLVSSSPHPDQWARNGVQAQLRQSSVPLAGRRIRQQHDEA